MIGRDAAQATQVRDVEITGPPIVRVADALVLGDRGDAAVRSVTFEIKRGEILGFGGVDGNGQLELAEALAGVRPLKSGSLEMPEAVYVPQDRQADGLALNMSIRENLFISAHSRPAFARGPFLKKSALTTWADSIRDRFGIKAASLDDPVSSLSGGNQQKVVVGRSLDENPSFLVVINPTRGLDFNATTFVQSQIRRVADAGAAVALFTTDHDELEALASRKVFLSSGSLHESLEESLVGGP
jgi:simple sugar transport system ATP-binding protein